MLKIENTYGRGKVIGRRRYASGNDVESSNDNPILYTRKYCVEFDDGEVRKLTENVIEESMYDACDGDGND